jgi:hypothetical protein
VAVTPRSCVERRGIAWFSEIRDRQLTGNFGADILNMLCKFGGNGRRHDRGFR